MELERVKALGVKPPQNLWEYKVNSVVCFLIERSIENINHLHAQLLKKTSQIQLKPCLPPSVYSRSHTPTAGLQAPQALFYRFLTLT